MMWCLLSVLVVRVVMIVELMLLDIVIIIELKLFLCM